MKSTRLAAAAIAFSLFAAAGSALAQQYYEPQYAPGPAHYGYRDAEDSMERRGYQDGVVGAQRDFQNHRRPDVNNRDEFRNPHFIPAWGQHEYREGFRRGYYQAVRQVYGQDRRHDFR